MNIKNFIKNIIEYWEHPYEKSIKLNIKDLSYENIEKKNEKELIKLKSLLIFKIKEKECTKSIFKFISKIGSLCVACLTIMNTSLNMLIQNFVAPLCKDISDKDKGEFVNGVISLTGVGFIINFIISLGILMLIFHLCSCIVERRIAMYDSKIFEIDEILSMSKK